MSEEQKVHKKVLHIVHPNVTGDCFTLLSSDEELLAYDHFYRNGIKCGVNEMLDEVDAIINNAEQDYGIINGYMANRIREELKKLRK